MVTTAPSQKRLTGGPFWGKALESAVEGSWEGSLLPGHPLYGSGLATPRHRQPCVFMMLFVCFTFYFDIIHTSGKAAWITQRTPAYTVLCLLSLSPCMFGYTHTPHTCIDIHAKLPVPLVFSKNKNMPLRDCKQISHSGNVAIEYFYLSHSPYPNFVLITPFLKVAL